MLIIPAKLLPAPALPLSKLLLALLLVVFVVALPAGAQTTWSYNAATTAPNVYYSSNPLTPASDGNIYWAEDDTNGGAIYQIAPSGGAVVIYSFTCTGSAACQPWGPLLQGADGFLYGMTTSGGLNSFGAFFKVAMDGSGFTDLYDFNGSTDGGGPQGGLTLGSDGNFYGISNLLWLSSATPRDPHHLLRQRGPAPSHIASTAAGRHTDGSPACSTATFFQLTPAGVFTPIYCATDTKLADSAAPLVQGADGNFYGMSEDVYESGGVLYQLTTSGGYTLLGSDLPANYAGSGALAGGPDGKFYVTVNNSSCGSIFQFDPANAYAQAVFADLDCTDASNSYSWGLRLASDGAFYSSSPNNSATSNAGSIFRVDSSGTITYSYDFVPGSGQNPYTSPVQNSAGTFFGTSGSMGGNSPDSGSAVIYALTGSPALAAPVTLTSSTSGNTVTLSWAVTNASPLTPPNCVALVNNATGVSGWSGMVYGAFSNGVYSGSAAVTQSTGAPVNYQIVCPSQGAASRSVSLSDNISSRTHLTIGPSNSMVTGTAATLTATVSRLNNCGAVNKMDCAVHSDSPGYPTGSVTFTWNNHTIGQATLSRGVATLPVNTTNLYADSYSVTASYSGSDIFATSSDTESGALTAIPTTATLTVIDAGRTPSSTNTISAGTNATLTAQVTASSGAAIPTGTVTFSSGSVDLGSAALNNGVATFSVSSAGVPSGSYTVLATYSGNRTHAAATSSGVNVTISKASTVTTVSANYSTVSRNQADQLTAIVTSSGNAPTGRVHFLWNNYFICAATLSNGSATCIGAAPSNAAHGPYSITAAYMGDRNNSASTSQPITITVAAP